MSVQAQLPDFRNRSNQPLHLVASGTVISDPHSELTCNVSGSRKRGRDQELLVAMAAFPQQNTGAPVQLLARLMESAGASTSCLAPELYAHLYQQNLEIDAIIRLHNERLRLEVEESRKRYCSYLISVMENGIMNRLREKEMELEIVHRKNAELEETIRQLSAENAIWFSIAKNSENTVTSLKSNLQQLLLQNAIDTDAVNPHDAEDVQSCCIEADNSFEPRTCSLASPSRACKACHEKGASVLLLPCKHLCVCEECGSKVDTCPICCGMKVACVKTNLQQ